MSAEDCVRAMVHLVDETDDAINLYNLGTGDTCSVRRIAEIVVEESGLEGVSIEYTGGDRGWAGDVPRPVWMWNIYSQLDLNQLCNQRPQSDTLLGL